MPQTSSQGGVNVKNHSFSGQLFSGQLFSRWAAAFATAIIALVLAGCGGGGGGGTSTSSGGGGAATCTAYAVPGNPTIYNTVPGNGTVQVQFSMSLPYGAPTTSYIVTANPGNITTTVAATASSTYFVNVNGLTNGTAYTFTAQGVNCLGAGTLSNSAIATPATVPNAPTIGAATSGNAQATVNFTPPANSGGAAITSYTLTSSPGGFSAIGAGSPIVVTGLTNGTSYTFTVTATNSAGTSLPSAASAAVTPSTVPGAPTSIVAMAGNAQATVSFLAPANNGGAAVANYTVTPSPAGTPVTATASPINVTGLTNGTSYTFTVTANNIDGSSVASTPSNAAIPISNPGPYYVNPSTGADTNPGTTGSPFKTLTWALAVAAGVGTSNTINAVAGTYSTGETFPLRMANNVNLVGAGSGTTTISGAGNYMLFGVARSTTLVIPPTATSTVSGFKITGGGEAIVIMDTATNVTLTGNIVTPGVTTGVAGIYVVATTSATLTGNTINGTCQGWQWGGVSLFGGGSTLYGRTNSISDTCNPAVSVYSDGTAAGSSSVDLGTSGSAGANTILGGTAIGGLGVGIYIYGNANWVYASGNTWHKNTQGANASGNYTAGTTGTNPSAVVTGNNYAVVPTSSALPSLGLQF